MVYRTIIKEDNKPEKFYIGSTINFESRSDTSNKNEIDKFLGYGLELFLSVKEENTREILHVIEVNERRPLNVIMKGCKPMCHHCDQTGHMQNECSDRQNNRVEQEDNIARVIDASADTGVKEKVAEVTTEEDQRKRMEKE